MATGFKRILQGLRLFPKTTSTVSEAGDLDFDTTSNKANLHNGTTSSPMVTEAHTATLTNKNLSDSTTAVTDVSDPTKQIKFDAAGTTGTSTTLLSSQTTNKTLTLPDATDTLIGKATTDTLTNKNLSDSTTAIADVSDPTKQIKFDAAGTTGTSTTLVSSQTTNKTLTLPDATDTLIGKATTDTLTNKTLTAPVMSDPTSTTFMEVSEISTPSTPASGKMRIYAKTDNILYTINDAGTETQVGSDSSILSITTKTANYTVTTNDDVIFADPTSGSFVLTLFTAVGNAGRVLKIKNIGTNFNTVTIDGAGAETIDGFTTRVLSTTNETITIVSTGSAWQVLDRKTNNDWQTYTPTVSNLGSGSGTVEGYWRRNGDSIDVYIGFVKDGTNGTGTTNVTFSLPSGLTATTTFQVAGQDQVVGHAFTYSIEANTQNSTSSSLLVSNNLLIENVGGAGTSYQGVDFRSGSIAIFTIYGMPITGWEA